MAEICYITYNKRKIVSSDKKHNDETEFLFFEQFDELDIEEIENNLQEGVATELEEKIEITTGKLVLKIRRVKEEKMEHIKISVFDSIEDCNEQNARETFFSNILDIEAVITKIVRMGTGLIKNDVKRIKNIIEKVYPELEVTEDEEKDSKELQMKQIVKMYYDILKTETENTEKSDIKKDIINMPSTVFKEIYENSEYYDKILMKDVRAYLKKNGITKCNVGTTDYVIKNNGKPQKVIAFYKEKLKEYA